MKLMIPEINATKNHMARVGGFAPAQWLLGRLPRSPGDQFDEDEFANLGVLQGRVDSGAAFSLRSAYRMAARKAFVKEDCGKRVARATLRKAAPLPGNYGVGDVVCFLKEQTAETQEDRWSPASRIVGFEGEKVCWLLCEGVPVCVAVDRIRPANASEALAYQYLRGQDVDTRGISQYNRVKKMNMKTRSTILSPIYQSVKMIYELTEEDKESLQYLNQN